MTKISVILTIKNGQSYINYLNKYFNLTNIEYL